MAEVAIPLGLRPHQEQRTLLSHSIKWIVVLKEGDATAEVTPDGALASLGVSSFPLVPKGGDVRKGNFQFVCIRCPSDGDVHVPGNSVISVTAS